MRLKTVTVVDYKSVRISLPFDVTDITCLVGKNEAGKTTLLEALYRLNPVIAEDGKFDVTDDYPRSEVEDYQQAVEIKKREHAVVIEAVFALDDQKDLADVRAKFGDPVIPNVRLESGASEMRALTLSKGYANELKYSFRVDEAATVRALVAKAQLPETVGKEASTRVTIKALSDFLAAKGDAQAKAHTDANREAEKIIDPTEKAKAIDAAKSLAETEGAKQLRKLLGEVLQMGLVKYLWETFLKAKVPKFLYFDEYYQMEGAVNLEKLKGRQANPAQLTPSDRPMLGLIDLARLNIDQLISPNRTQSLLNKIEGASNHLSKQILKYWSQNKHIELRFDVRPALAQDPEGMRDGHNLWGMVHDSVHKVSTGLGARSRGFVWFFSFLAWYSQQRKSADSLILLLDEPGLFLHASAQGDFLRYMEAELKPEHQVIYTTHSPFLVDARRFDRVRIVEDKSMETDDELPPERQGTKVYTDVLEVSQGTLFPLQGALGYQIAQTLFIGPNSLIVEGPSDLLYIQAISSVLERGGRTGLSPKWVVTPVGGADKVPAFAALIGAQSGLNVATLIDLQTTHQQRVENLYKLKLLQKSHVHTFAEFTGTAEADIEDMFETDFYLGLVNREYASSLKAPIQVSAVGAGARIVPRVESLFDAGAAGGLKFNHYRPARCFGERLAEVEQYLNDKTLDRFEAAFKVLNALLPN
jgi:predicted ATPase